MVGIKFLSRTKHPSSSLSPNRLKLIYFPLLKENLKQMVFFHYT